jgi:L-threonylcarbamoyladenylate synthase
MSTTADAVAALRRGEVVAFPTESSFGLAVPALDEAALERLFSLKQRDAKSPPPVLVAGDAMLTSLVRTVPERARQLMEKYWPGPLTLGLPARTGLPSAIVASGTVGVRWSPHPVATALVAAFGAPLTATSANPSGQAPAMSAAAARAYFEELVVLDGEAGRGKPSTVVQVAEGGELTLIRQGAIPFEELVERSPRTK